MTAIREWRPNGAAAAWWCEVEAGSKALVAYKGDSVVHVRVLIMPAGPRGETDQWWVYTPDGDLYVEDLSGADPLGVASSAPLADDAEPDLDIYKFREEPDKRAIAKLKEEALMCTYRCPNKQVEQGTQTAGVAELKTSGTGEETVEERPGHSWLLAEPLGKREIGSPLKVSECSGMSFGTRAFMEVEGVHVVAELVENNRVKEYVEDRCEFLRRACHRAAPGLTPREGMPSLGRVAPEGGPPKGVEDGRTLWVDWDAHGVRYKAWREAVAESTQLTFDDNPDTPPGPNTAIHSARAMERRGGDPVRWLEGWCREKRLETGDRSVFELRSLCEVFRSLGSYDQCNLGGLLAAELVARRIAAIVDAYAVPTRPSWHAAKYFQGLEDDFIAPGLRTHVSRRRKEENELMTHEQRRGPAAVVEGGEGDGEGRDGAAGGRKGGKGGGGKGGRRGQMVPLAVDG